MLPGCPRFTMCVERGDENYNTLRLPLLSMGFLDFSCFVAQTKGGPMPSPSAALRGGAAMETLRRTPSDELARLQGDFGRLGNGRAADCAEEESKRRGRKAVHTRTEVICEKGINASFWALLLLHQSLFGFVVVFPIDEGCIHERHIKLIRREIVIHRSRIT